MVHKGNDFDDDFRRMEIFIMAFALGIILVVAIWFILKMVINRWFLLLRNISSGNDLVLVTRRQNQDPEKGLLLKEETHHIKQPPRIFGITVLPLPYGSASMQETFVYECLSWSMPDHQVNLVNSDDYIETRQLLLKENTVESKDVIINQAKVGSSEVLVKQKQNCNKNCRLCSKDFDVASSGSKDKSEHDDASLKDNNVQLMTMICGHTFHAECSLQMFLKRCYLCPICKQSMVVGYVNNGFIPQQQMSSDADGDDVFISPNRYGTFAD